MSLVVPNVGEEVVLNEYLKSGNLKLRLYSNNVTPAEGDTAASYTQVSGGGYSEITLVAANWVVTPGAPSTGVYAQQSFSFTGVTVAPGTIYGYYVVDLSNILLWAERFEASVVPFTPTVGSVIKVTPRLECS